MHSLEFPGRRRALAAFAAALGSAVAGPALGAPGGLPSNIGHADSSPEWDRLRERLFGQRPLIAGEASKVQLQVPLRATFGASVPVKVVSRITQTPELSVRRLWLVVDKNPSGLSATLDLGPEVGQADFETRLRVDEYSHIRVVSELSNGELHTDSRYVKVSGGCSAPPNRDQLHHIGRTVLRLPAGVKPDQPTLADVQVTHPNDTGFELNHQTVMYIPPHFVRTLNVTYAGRKVFDADLDFSIAENPSFRFYFVPRGEGELVAEVEDSREGRYTGRLAVPTPASLARAQGEP